MTKIHIVIGHSYSYDYSEVWVVAAYLHKDLAEKHCQQAQDRANEIYGFFNYTERKEFSNQYDQQMDKEELPEYLVNSIDILDIDTPIRVCESCSTILAVDEHEFCAKCERALKIEVY